MEETSGMSVSAVLANLIKATREELDVAKQRSQQRTYVLTNGNLIKQGPINFEVSFERKDSNGLEEGANGQINTRNASRRVEILSVTDSQVVLLIEGEPLSDLTSITVTIDESWLTEQLLATLIEQEAGRMRFNSLTAMQCVGKGATKEFEEGFIRSDDLDLNVSQTEAIEIATSCSPSFIWGPPGTGKTYTLGKLVSMLVAKNERVLMASNTNVAVDTALLTTVRSLSDHPEIANGLVIRFGPIQRGDVYSEIAELVDINILSARKAQPLEARIQELRRQQKQIEVDANVTRENLAKIMQYRELFQGIDALNSRATRLEERIKKSVQKEVSWQQEIKILQERIDGLRSKSSLSRILTGDDNPRTLEQKRSKLVADCAELLSDIRYDKNEVSRVQREIQSFRDRIPTDLQGEYDEAQVIKADKKILQLRIDWTDLQTEVNRIQTEISLIPQQILNNAKAVFTTAYRTQSQAFADIGNFQTAIIDEASMLPLPLAWVVAGKAQKRFIAAGDFRQIPAISRSEARLSQEWYSKDVFSAHEIPVKVEANDHVNELGMLNVQYRMPKPISDLVSEFAYPEHGLICATEKPGGSQFNPDAVLLIDTSHAGAFLEKENNSRANSKHVEIVVRLFDQLLSSGDLNHEDLIDQVAIVTPYRPQAKRIIDALTPIIGADTAKRIVVTVHRMQGNEKDFVILDLVEAPPESIGMPFKGVRLSEQGPRLLNVAISRARKQLVVIATMDHMSGRATSGNSYRGTQSARFIQLIEKYASRISWNDFQSIELEMHAESVDTSPPLKPRGTSLQNPVAKAAATEKIGHTSMQVAESAGIPLELAIAPYAAGIPFVQDDERLKGRLWFWQAKVDGKCIKCNSGSIQVFRSHEIIEDIRGNRVLHRFALFCGKCNFVFTTPPDDEKYRKELQKAIGANSPVNKCCPTCLSDDLNLN